MRLFGCEVFSFEGRINRLLFIKQFLTLMVFYNLVVTPVTYLWPSPLPALALAIYMLSIAFDVGKSCLYVRRLHDLGLSGYWALACYLLEFLISILVVSSIFASTLVMLLFIVILMVFKGTSGPNKYGRDPLQPEVKEKSLNIESETYFETDKEEPVNEHKSMGKKVNVKLFGHEIFSIAGRLNRAPFIRFALLALLLILVNTKLFYQYLVIEKMLTENQIATGFLFLVSFVAFIVTHVAFCAVIIRRLHDLGSSEFWVIVWIVDLVIGSQCDVGSELYLNMQHILLYLAVFLSVFKGTSGTNQYGIDLLQTEAKGERLKAESNMKYEIENWKYFVLFFLLRIFL